MITIEIDELMAMWTQAERLGLALWPDLNTEWADQDGDYKPVDDRLTKMYQHLLGEKIVKELRSRGID